MTGSIKRQPDGSIALFIRDDLQFDSKDERIYHECLSLPALAIATRRAQSKLRVLIIGGGDGLVAREILKSPQVSSIDLVDYDPEILTFAKNDFRDLNEGSLLNDRVSLHIKDAWLFVDEALASNALYDVIVSDLTVPEDTFGARFHSIDWYTKLSKLLTDAGVLAVNAVSPQATPKAYWSIFNSITAASLQARPYHINLPSFTAQGFGEDWGFFIAAKEAINLADVSDNLLNITPRHYLNDTSQLEKLFDFPSEFFNYQKSSLPALAGSNILLHYFNNAEPGQSSGGNISSSFALDTASIKIPEADTGKEILPPEIRYALANSLQYNKDASEIDRSSTSQMFLYGVLDLMPSLNRAHTQEVIEDFLAHPESFLQALDLPGLVARLLKRAAELPARLVEELELLQEKLRDWTGDSMSLLNLTERVITIILLVVVVGNLLYPDSVYAKGAAGAHHAAAHSAAPAAAGHHGGGRGGRGVRGIGGVGGTYYNGTNWVNRRPVNNVYTTKVIKQAPPKKINYAPPALGPNGIHALPNQMSSSEYVDAAGRLYPARRFRIEASYLNGLNNNERTDAANELANTKQAIDCYAAYRLGPGADILPTGHIALQLTNGAYLLLTQQAMHLIDHASGSATITLGHDRNVVSTLSEELNRQHDEMAPDSLTLNYLTAARSLIDNIQMGHAADNKPELDDQTDLFPSTWIAANGKYLAIKLLGDNVVYLDGRGWYKDKGITPLSETYPIQANAHFISYLGKIIREGESTQNALLRDKRECETHIAMLSQELAAYMSSNESEVKFGSRNTLKGEAIRLTELSIKRSALQVSSLQQYADRLPARIELAKLALANLSQNIA